MDIIFFCLICVEYCQKASKHMVEPPMQTESMQKTCEGLSRVFSSFAKDFEKIAKMVGLELDLTTKNGEIIVKKINSLADLNKTQRKKCLKEIEVILRKTQNVG